MSQELLNFISEELKVRRAKNPRYSLRAHAKTLGISPAYLCQVLSGKRHFTPRLANKFAARLKFDDAQTESFLMKAVASEIERKKEIVPSAWLKKARKAAQKKPLKLTQSAFARASEWYHWALSALAEVEGFSPDPVWIAKRLGVKPETALKAIQDLIAIGQLQWQGETLKPRSEPVAVEGTVALPSALIRRFHASIWNRARRAIDFHPQATRVLGGLTVATTPEKLGEANRRLAEFRQEMREFLEDCDQKTAVYHLSTHLFRLDKP